MSDFIPEDCDLDNDEDCCVHGKSFSVICVECRPEDKDGSLCGDEWSEG